MAMGPIYCSTSATYIGTTLCDVWREYVLSIEKMDQMTGGSGEPIWMIGLWIFFYFFVIAII